MNTTDQAIIQQQFKKAKPFKKFSFSRSDITIELLEKARAISAQLVKEYGDGYLPIFICLHDEIQKKNNQLSYKKMALQLLEIDS